MDKDTKRTNVEIGRWLRVGVLTLTTFGPIINSIVSQLRQQAQIAREEARKRGNAVTSEGQERLLTVGTTLADALVELKDHPYSQEIMRRGGDLSGALNERSGKLSRVLAEQGSELLERGSKATQVLTERGNDVVGDLAVRGSKATQVLSERGSKATQVLAERGSELVGDLAERGNKATQVLAERGSELVGDLAERSSKATQVLAERGSELVGDLAERSSKVSKDVAKRSERLSKEVAKRSERLSKEVAKRSEKLAEEVSKDVAKRSEVLSKEVAKRSEKLAEEVAKRSEVLSKEVAKRSEKLAEEVGKRSRVATEQVSERKGLFWSIFGFSLGLSAALVGVIWLIRRRTQEQSLESQAFHITQNGHLNGAGKQPAAVAVGVSAGQSTPRAAESATPSPTLQQTPVIAQAATTEEKAPEEAQTDAAVAQQPLDAKFVALVGSKLYYPIETPVEQLPHTEGEPLDVVYFDSEEEAQAQGFSAAE